MKGGQKRKNGRKKRTSVNAKQESKIQTKNGDDEESKYNDEGGVSS